MSYFRLACLAIFALAIGHDSFGDDNTYRPNNTIVLACDVADQSYVTLQKIHTTIEPAEKFIRKDGQWIGDDPDWEGTAEQLQTTYVGGWSIEVHYDDAAIEKLGRWKHSTVTGNDYAVIVGKHVPAGLSTKIEFATRDEQGCMLSRKFGLDANPKSSDETDWHQQDWDFVVARTEAILKEHGFAKPWQQYKRAKLASTLANWIKDARLRGPSVEDNLHPADALEAGQFYCGGAANTFVAMCSVLKIPARYFSTLDHGFAEFQDDGGQWHFVENQPDTFANLRTIPPNPFDLRADRQKAQQWAHEQNFDATFAGGIIDVVADPAKFNLADDPSLGWFYNWTCPANYRPDGISSGADLVSRPQVLQDWVFNLYTGYGDYQSKYIRRRGMFVANRLGSVYELAAMYSPRRDDLPYVCGKRENNDNIVFLTPWRDSYYNDWNNPAKIAAGKSNGVRKQFWLSDSEEITKVVAAIILGQDGNVDHQIPRDGGNWYYEVNGHRFPLAEHGGFELTPNYQGTGMTVQRFEVPMQPLSFTLAE